MSNTLTIFNNPEFGKIRALEIKGAPWFVGKDVAQALGYGDTDQALRKHVEDDDKLTRQFDGAGQRRNMTIINESGLYSLILSSKLPGAKKFKRWVTHDVLPAIRKTGRYEHGMTDYQRMTAETRAENARIRKAQSLIKIAEQYDGAYRQVLHAHAAKELTGEFILPLPMLPRRTYSAGEIGNMLGISANRVGMIANANGLKREEYGSWFHDKAKNCDKQVQCFRYFDTVIPVIKELLTI